MGENYRRTKKKEHNKAAEGSQRLRREREARTSGHTANGDHHALHEH